MAKKFTIAALLNDEVYRAGRRMAGHHKFVLQKRTMPCEELLDDMHGGRRMFAQLGNNDAGRLSFAPSNRCDRKRQPTAASNQRQQTMRLSCSNLFESIEKG